MADPLLPGQHGSVTDKDGRATIPWYSWFRFLDTRVKSALTIANAASTAVAAIPAAASPTVIHPSADIEPLGNTSVGYTLNLSAAAKANNSQTGPRGRKGEDGEPGRRVVIQSGSATGGAGNVVGPASSTDGDLALFDGTTGKLLKDSTLTDFLDAQIGTTEGLLLRRGVSSWVGLGYPADNTLYLDGTGVYSSPAATGGAGYATALDLDFSAQGNQTLSSDTTYSIGGVTWTKVNSSADRVSMAVVNGSGLVIDPISASAFNGTTRTAPYIHMDLPTLIPAFYLGLPLRVWIYFSADSTSASGHGAGLSLDNLSTDTNKTCVFTVRRGNNSGTKSIEAAGTITGTSISYTANSSNLDSTDRVVMADLATGRLAQISGIYAGAYSSGFPSVSAMVPRQKLVGSNNSYPITQDFVTGLPLKLALFAQRGGSGTTFSVTIARIKVEYRVS